MANYSADAFANSYSTSSFSGLHLPERLVKVFQNPETVYLMRGIDVDASPNVYVTWLSVGSADMRGVKYRGFKSGSSALGSITVLSTWQST